MQVTVTIPDELATQVRAQGLTPESYVERLLAERNEALQRTGRKTDLSPDEFKVALDELARYSEKIPELAGESFGRASFYQDHD